MELRTFVIDDEVSLLQACSWLHDAACDVDASIYDSESGTWNAVFDRLTGPTRVIKQGIIWDHVAFGLVESALVLERLRSFEVDDKSGIGTYTFSGCVRVKDAYRLEFNEGLDITLAFVDEPRGALRDIRTLEREDSSTRVLHRRQRTEPR